MKIKKVFLSFVFVFCILPIKAMESDDSVDKEVFKQRCWLYCAASSCMEFVSSFFQPAAEPRILWEPVNLFEVLPLDVLLQIIETSCLSEETLQSALETFEKFYIICQHSNIIMKNPEFKERLKKLVKNIFNKFLVEYEDGISVGITGNFVKVTASFEKLKKLIVFCGLSESEDRAGMFLNQCCDKMYEESWISMICGPR